MHFTSARPFRLSIASASSTIMGTVSTLYGGKFSVIFAAKVVVSNVMYLKIWAGLAGELVAMGFLVCAGIIRRNRASGKTSRVQTTGGCSPESNLLARPYANPTRREA